MLWVVAVPFSSLFHLYVCLELTVKFYFSNVVRELKMYNQFMRLVSELDLDFLEKRQNAVPNAQTIGQSLKSPIEVSPESVDRVKVIILGAPAVGKTSIIQVHPNLFFGSQKATGTRY